MQERVEVFRSEFREFSQLDDEHVETMIRVYDFNLDQKLEPCDPSLTVVGFMMIWFGWMFFSSASGINIVEYSYDQVPQVIILNNLISSSSAGITYFILQIIQSTDNQDAMNVYLILVRPLEDEEDTEEWQGSINKVASLTTKAITSMK